MSVVTEEVAQVSITASSGVHSLHPQAQARGGWLSRGFTGSWLSSANRGLWQALQYHTGKGTPKYLCLEIHQSHFRFSTHEV